MIMENNNDWFENLNYPCIDHQQQTFVTKHDLELLHKKIIATDLIVQKYQEANRALLRLQVENDDLQKQIEQITNECCIFSKQVTECTQECDSLKEQIEISNSEKRELHQQLRLLQDENTSNHHEIMVLRQFESLKDTNEQLNKTVERQQKTIGKLQLQVQRKSPVVYKPVKNRQEPSETDIALAKSQKSVLELRLALGRLVNFIQLSKIEIPTALHIRPVLKAHDINDDFLEIEGDIPRNPVTQTPKPVVSQTDDDDDDDDHGDFIDVNHSIPVPVAPVQTTNVIEKPSVPSRAEQKKSKPKRKSRRKKDVSTSENTSTKLDELANELELALSQTTYPEHSSLTDDEDGHPKQSKSDNQSQSLQTNSTITITRTISFFSDDESPQKLPSVTRQQIPVNQRTKNPLHIDSIIPMEIETMNIPTQYMSCLSEDDDDNNRSVSSMSTQEYISPLTFNELTSNEDIYQPILPVKPSSNQQLEIISSKIPDPPATVNNRTSTVASSIPSKTLNPNHRQIVLRLLNVLTQAPVPLKPLRLIHRRTPKKLIAVDPVAVPIVSEQVSKSMGERTISIEETSVDHTSSIESPLQSKEQTPTVAENDTFIDKMHEEPQTNTEETKITIGEVQTPANIAESRYTENMDTKSTEIQAQTAAEEYSDYDAHQQPQVNVEESYQTQEIDQTTTEMLPQATTEENTIKEEYQRNQQVSIEEDNDIEENNITATETHTELPISTEKDHHTEEIGAKVIESSRLQETIDQENDHVTESTATISEEPYNSMEETSLTEPLVAVKELSTIPLSQESKSVVEPVAIQHRAPHLVSKPSSQCPLKPFQMSILTRLLNTLINLPVKPLHLPVPFPRQKRKRKSAVVKASLPPSRQSTDRSSRSPVRMQTRSLSSIRARIARCNQPATVTKKRTITESVSPPASARNVKRMKSTNVEVNNNEYDLLEQFLDSSNKKINEPLRNFLQRKLHENISSMIDQLYRILREFLMKNCNLSQQVTKQFQSYEFSIKTLLTYIRNQSSIFQQQFIKKLNQTFEQDIKQDPKSSNEQIKILNRLFILTCSIFASSSISSITVYPRLFDIGYSLTPDILDDATSYVSIKFPSLISNEIQHKSSNGCLHKVLFNILNSQSLQISYTTLEDLLITYQKESQNQSDLIRSFVLIFRRQTWLWCCKELCSKILFPMLDKMTDQYPRLIFLTILQMVLSVYREDENFKEDVNFHGDLQQRLKTLKTVNKEEVSVRENILSILRNP